MFASLVAHHCSGDVFEEPNEVLLRVSHGIVIVSHDVEEGTRPCRCFDDHLSLVLWRPKLIVLCHLASATSDALLSTSKVLIHEVVWPYFIIMSIVVPLT